MSELREYLYCGARLTAPDSFLQAPQAIRDRYCNGMGPAGKGWLVPNTMYCLNVAEAGRIHDWQYSFPEGRARKEIDDLFFDNMVAIIDTGARWLRWLRQRRAATYYAAVRAGGAKHFAGP